MTFSECRLLKMFRYIFFLLRLFLSQNILSILSLYSGQEFFSLEPSIEVNKNPSNWPLDFVLSSIALSRGKHFER